MVGMRGHDESGMPDGAVSIGRSLMVWISFCSSELWLANFCFKFPFAVPRGLISFLINYLHFYKRPPHVLRDLTTGFVALLLPMGWFCITYMSTPLDVCCSPQRMSYELNAYIRNSESHQQQALPGVHSLSSKKLVGLGKSVKLFLPSICHNVQILSLFAVEVDQGWRCNVLHSAPWTPETWYWWYRYSMRMCFAG